MPSLEEEIDRHPKLLIRLSVKELDAQLNRNPVLLAHDFGNGDTILHAFIRKKKKFRSNIISYQQRA